MVLPMEKWSSTVNKILPGAVELSGLIIYDWIYMIDCKMERKSKLKFYFNFFAHLFTSFKN